MSLIQYPKILFQKDTYSVLSVSGEKIALQRGYLPLKQELTIALYLLILDTNILRPWSISIISK